MQYKAGQGTPFSLVLIDSRMPQFDGFQLAEAIKFSPELDSATIMMLSSSDLPGEIARCKALGVTRFLRKPIKQSELFDAILTAVNIAPLDGTRVTDDAQPLRTKAERRLNVLIAEDHPVNRALLTEILIGRGHSVSIANNGIEVLHMLDRQSFDIILMDGQMPEMDGYQATVEIRRREKLTGKHIHIIAVTAHAMKDDRERCLAAGMDDYVTKPIDPDQLLERLEIAQVHSIESGSGHQATEVVAGASPRAFDFENALKRSRGQLTLLKQLAHLFLQNLPKALDDIESAVAAGDARALERSAHRLKGAASLISADALAEAANKLERMGRNNELDRLQEVAMELKARAPELVTTLEAFTGSDS
jgi:two-component system sensor histidine kinase/response regulator